MGNNVTTTPVEVMKIDETNDDRDDTDVHNNKNQINDFSYEEYNTEHQNNYLDDYQNDEQFNGNWNHYNQQYMGYPNEVTTHETNAILDKSEAKINSVKEYNDESKDVLSAMIAKNISNELNADKELLLTRPPKLEMSNSLNSLPLLVKSLDGNKDYIREIDDLESIESDSKLTLNDNKSDTEEVLQELNKLDLDLDDRESKYPMRYSSRKRGQSWSNWDNNMHVELNAESSLSSFSRPASTNEIPGLKSKSYTAPETRGQMDYIEFLAKEHGLEIGSGLEFDRHHKPTESRNSQRQSRNTFRLSSMEIPGSISLSSTPIMSENHIPMNTKYDEFDQQIMSSIENDFIR